MSSPSCLVNGTATTNGVNVTAGATVTIALADLGGAGPWGISCVGTDEGQVAATITASLSINQSAKTATFTAPTVPCTLRFLSTVQGGNNPATGQPDASLSTTFGVFVLLANGRRLVATNQTYESNASFGWVKDLNDAIRGAQSGVAGYNIATYGVSIAIDQSLGDIFVITVTDAVAFTIANPSPSVRGQHLLFDIVNSSGGAMGAITWGASYKLAGAFTNPANGKRRTILFYNNGSSLIEVSRAAADI